MRILLTIAFFFISNLSMAQENILQQLLQENKSQFADVLDRPEQYDVQIIYTQINRDEKNTPSFNSFNYNLDKKKYYYPASTVKMPMAFLALEKLNRLNIIGLDKNSTMINGAGSPPQTAAQIDTTSASGLPTVAHYIKKIFLVSDNDANNRLYEFLGQEYVNRTLWEKGYKNTKLTHRLGISGFDAEANRHTNPVYFYNKNHELKYQQGEVYSKTEKDFNLNKTLRGTGFYRNGELINEAFDFSGKNYISMQDQHDILKAVIFPASVPAHQRFELTEDDYRFLYQVMSERPKESKFPQYDKPDHYVKFFMFGDRKDEEQMPDNIRIFNKVGWAYGFLTDVSYVVDFENNIEFFLAATIHVNKDGIYNDNNYEYESIGIPFLTELGNIIYKHEKKRAKKYLPDLSKFKIQSYD
ncbi:MAG: serine hydrolase [Bacteroidota bacterium]